MVLTLSHTAQIPCDSADHLFPAHLNGVTTEWLRLGGTEPIFLELGGAGGGLGRGCCTRLPGPRASQHRCDSGQQFRMLILGRQTGEGLFAAEVGEAWCMELVS